MDVQPKIAIKNISKVFGRDVKSSLAMLHGGASKSDILKTTGQVVGLRNVSLDIEAGKTSVIMGLSGSGKSTLIRHINRLIEPSHGQMLFEGQDILQLNHQELRELRRHKISMVFQSFGLLPHKTVLENVAYPLMISGIQKSPAQDAAMIQIEQVGLAGFEAKFPQQLSGGMRQRVGLARALATNADVLLMDEAFSALDPLIRNDMQHQLKELQGRLNKTIVFITHDLDEALLLGDQISILKDGELRQSGTRQDILLAPADDYVRRFVRDVNRARVVTVGSVAERCVVLSNKKPSAAQILDAEREKTRAFVKLDAATKGYFGATLAQIKSNQPMVAITACYEDMVLEDALPLLSGEADCVVVTNQKSDVLGVLTKTGCMRALVRKNHTSDADGNERL